MPLNNTTTGKPQISAKPFPLSIFMAISNLLVMLLIIPPMFWHFRNRNIGATALVAWVLVLLFFHFINAIIWPSDDWTNEYNGGGLCDVEVKIQIASQVGLPASFACILRALAAVLDTDNATLMQTRTQRRRAYTVDLLWCVGFPLLQMVFDYIVQRGRYYIFGIAGCTPILATSWLTLLLIYVPPTIWTAIDTYFAIIILIRLYRYRLNFSSILASSNTTKSRFMRLYLICILWIFCAIPMLVYAIAVNAPRMQDPYSWKETHNAATSNMYVFQLSHGQLSPDAWFPLACGLGVFIFFGLGKEAVAMYKSCLTAVGLGGCISSLTSESTKTISSLGDKARLLLKRKEAVSNSTWSSGSSNGTLSPNGKSLSETVDGSVDTTCRKEKEEGVCLNSKRSLRTKVWAMKSPAASSRHSDLDISMEELGAGKTMLPASSAADVSILKSP